MGTKKDVFTVNKVKDILQIHLQSKINFFNLTLERMDKKNQRPDWRKRCTEK